MEVFFLFVNEKKSYRTLFRVKICHFVLSEITKGCACLRVMLPMTPASSGQTRKMQTVARLMNFCLSDLRCLHSNYSSSSNMSSSFITLVRSMLSQIFS